MKVSLITVAYNSGETIRDTFESVLSQTYQDIEYIVIDGNSKDNTVSLIKQYEPKFGGRMKWLSEPDNGLYDAMNKGIEMATGDVVGIINSDDLFCDNQAVEKVIGKFGEFQSLDAVYADLYYVAQNDINHVIRRWKTGVQKPFRKGWHPAHPTFYVKRCVYVAEGCFNLNFRLAADFEIMLRFVEKDKIRLFYLSDPLVKMRLGGTTNKNFKNIFKQNVECLNAFKLHKISVNPLLYPFYRIIPKFLQYLK